MKTRILDIAILALCLLVVFGCDVARADEAKDTLNPEIQAEYDLTDERKTSETADMLFDDCVDKCAPNSVARSNAAGCACKTDETIHWNQ